MVAEEISKKRPLEAADDGPKFKAPAKREDKIQNEEPVAGKLPVSTLCGFLGAGKTTLLRHILECKHEESKPFRCAVIVNDMAELNIDASLIDYSGLVQSEDMIAMQNGCVCCTLQNDLLQQMVELAQRKYFHYMIIEASGVSEPSQIAKLFAECEDYHDDGQSHGHAHSHDHLLGEHARLDTCVTVVDTHDFFKKFEAIRQGSKGANFPQLLAEQVEYANVVILNKTDLVTEEQIANVTERITVLNPKAKILTSEGSKIDVKEVVNTGLWKAADFEQFHNIGDGKETEDGEMKSCCAAKVACGELPCCRSKRTIDSGKSKVVLSSNRAKQGVTPRHASRFGITSFIYQARRPFHPRRFWEDFGRKFFICPNFDEETGDGQGEGEGEGEKAEGEGEKKTTGILSAINAAVAKSKKLEDAEIKKQQEEADAKQKLRTQEIGDLFRSKGFFWLANMHDYRGVMSQAGSVLTTNFNEMWNVHEQKAWEGSEKEKAAIRKDWQTPWGDRRQDLVFIGTGLKHEAIQAILDECMLTDDELLTAVNQPTLCNWWPTEKGTAESEADDKGQ
eukprot:TRINITY_DN111636_c0_g1_i1.p1 TRINITY_DN111636_c0_g1~~TRINITY_DN111636_c0_g1_i1.p1  ORF type:complete len:564 (-),score=130.95 TRINITY_DN111636_c0_g1_i1:405-2096(-)